MKFTNAVGDRSQTRKMRSHLSFYDDHEGIETNEVKVFVADRSLINMGKFWLLHLLERAFDGLDYGSRSPHPCP
ncbi:hypothetical protein [Nodosilinea sp. E11]|uniref:hypothetical protein n=1 Tax=Nodosilinea sp. E11 TaxID=3037479 RepID=UPI0029346AAC|nr:hypothetical protein [Nodosilinea sp. E11]WOD39222.1 hypothetical protein RRF56_23735 [Nodosilinea sp. E11]